MHLSAAALDILRALPRLGDKGYLFTTTGTSPVSGFGRARERLVAAMAKLNGGEVIDAFTLHDLRRTAATGMAGLGIAHHVLDRVLNHTAGKISGVARIYNRHEYADERRIALEAWALHVEGLANPAPKSNVIPLAAAG